jgi:hypothetical protein
VENRLLKKTEDSKIKTAKRIQNVKDAAKGQNDYKMSGLLSNATFIDKSVYHSGYITKYLLTRTPGTSYEFFAVWLGKKTDHSFLSTFKFKCHLTVYKILFALVKEKQSVQVAVCVLRKGCLAPTFVRAKQVKYVAIRTHKCPEIKA